MAVRTQISEVKAIIETELADGDITAYIGTANTLVNSVLGTGMTDLLTEIEKWLAAHLIASTRERMGQVEKAGTASIEYVGTTGEGLKSTPYGQMVLTLDTTGAMSSLYGKSAKMTAIKSFD